MAAYYRERIPLLPYLLNLLYILLILAMLPWLLWQAAKKGKYREGYAAKFLGLVPRRAADKNASGCTPSAWAR